MSPSDRIIRSKIQLQNTFPFYAYLLMSMKVHESKPEHIPTMGVNKIGDLYYNAEFVKTLDDSQLMGVLCHEVLHIATNTFGRQGIREHTLWNVATDFVINWIITNEKPPENTSVRLTLPKDCLLADANGDVVLTNPQTKKSVKFNLKNMCAEEVYDKLLTVASDAKAALGIGANGEGPNGKGTYKGQIDTHIPGDNDDKGNSQGKVKNEADDRANAGYWRDKAVEAATSAKMRGSFSSLLEREIGNLLEPKIDWRKKLIHFVTKDLPVDFTMRKPGRRTYSMNTYMPSIVRENLEILIGIDVSGSIGQEEYDSFMSEIVGLARGFQQLKMRVIFWSTYVDERDDIEVAGNGIDRLLTHKVNNSGGTTMGCLAEYIELKQYKAPAIIVFTDGYVESNPKMANAKHLFVLSKQHSDEIVKNLGEVCNLNDVEM